MEDKREYALKAGLGSKEDSILSCIHIVASTAAGLGVGLIGVSIVVASLAAVNVVLPQLLCLRAGGLLGGGFGLVLGVNSIRKRLDKRRAEIYR